VEGYQVSLAYLGAYDEAIQLYLDPGNVHCKDRLAALLRDVDRLLGPEETAVDLVCRLDAGYDSAQNRVLLAARPGYVGLKGAQREVARRLAQREVARRLAPGGALQEGRPVTDAGHGTEVAPAESGVRRLVYALHHTDGTVEYALLYTNLPAAWGLGRLFTFYNERTTIEAFFAAARHVYNVQNLRSRKFHAIYAFLRFVILTHNLLHWAKQARLAPTALVTATTRQLVCSAARVRAHIHWDGHWHIRILRSSPWAALLIEALTAPPQPVQLALPFARLHKT
jgi:hypothetical protein